MAPILLLLRSVFTLLKGAHFLGFLHLFTTHRLDGFQLQKINIQDLAPNTCMKVYWVAMAIQVFSGNSNTRSGVDDVQPATE